MTCTSTGNTAAWDQVGYVVFETLGNNGRLTVWVQTALTTATGTVVTVSYPGDNTSGNHLYVFGVSGMTKIGAAAVRQDAQDDVHAAGTPQATALAAAALAENPVLIGVHDEGTAVGWTPPTNWIESEAPVGEQVITVPDSRTEVAARSSGFTGTTVTWGSSSTGEYASYVLELDTSSEVTLVIQDATHGHAADNLALTQDHFLTVADALHAQAADNVALIINLAIQDALHAHTTDGIVLTQLHILAIADALHAHLGDNVVLTQLHVLAIQDAIHAQLGDNVTLTQVHVLAIQDALHAHAADNLVLVEESAGDLVIQDAIHGHAADSLTLTQAHVLVVADALHAHAGDNLVLTQVHNLTIQDALHAHLGDNVALSIPGAGPGPNTDPPVRMRRRLWTGS